MSKSLIIAEKPSVAQDIVRALTPSAGKFEKHAEHFESERYVVTSAVGHLVEIKAPEEFDVKRGKWSFAHLPVVPPHFDLAPIDKAKSRLNAVVKLVKRKDVTELINACDAGREGELIFRLIVQYAGNEKKPIDKPVQRLWLQSMTPQAIRDGFESLRSDEQMLGLADAARSRSEADWLVGINGTRAMTAFNSRDGGFFLTTVGRVQTPTLSIVVEREEKIRKHVSRPYWEVRASFAAQAGEYEGKWFDPKFKKDEDAERRADRVWNEADAQAIAQACRGQPASVKEESKPSSQASPLLYDLTTLQREANSRFGFSAKTTLSLAQALYEKHKVLTYPRTDSRALPEDYLSVVKDTMTMLSKEDLPGPLRPLAGHAKTALKEGYVKPIKRVFDNAKVSDHFAIIPTLQAPKSLTEIEAKLYDLVVKRFLAVFYPSAESMVTTRISTVKAGGKEHKFQTNGKVLVKPGWLAVYGKEAQEDDANLVAVAARRGGAHRGCRRQRAEDQAAGTLHRGHAAQRDGRRGQADRRRRVPRGDGREGPGHAGHARAGDRGPAAREIHAPRRPRAGADRQGLPADDAAARPGYRGPDQARTDRQLGIPARRDGAWPPEALGLHGRDRADGRAHRQEGQGVRPRHHSRRLRHAVDAVPELRRRGQGELPALRL